MASISTIRHDEVFDAKANDYGATIIGMGATGSRVFSALAELGLAKLRAIDPDIVESHNLANQLYASDDIGTPKTVAAARWFMAKTGLSAQSIPETLEFIQGRVPNDTKDVTGTVFLLTDSMASRREIFEKVLYKNTDVFTVIETRMASTHGNVYVFDPNDEEQCEKWEASLTDDKDAEVSACGSSISIGTTASIIANVAVWQFMHVLTNPEAVDQVTDIYLKPFVISTRNL